MTPERTNQTPRKKFLRESLRQTESKLKIAQSKIKTLQKKVKRTEKRTANWQTIFSELRKKKYLEDNEVEILTHLSKSNADLLKRQLQESRDKYIPRTYSPDLRSFALTLHYYSPRAYTYAENLLILVYLILKLFINGTKL